MVAVSTGVVIPLLVPFGGDFSSSGSLLQGMRSVPQLGTLVVDDQ